MTEKIICDAEDLTAIADAVRASTGSTETYNVSELSEAAVNAIGSGGVEIDDTLTVAGAAADSKATGDAITALSEEIAKLPQGGGGGSAIIDVTVLPETDIREDVFYRVVTGEFYANKTPWSTAKCHVVETLPETGVPATDATLSEIQAYYAADTGEVSGYLPEELAAAFGLPAGWYPAEVLFQAAGVQYGGIVSNLEETVSDGTLYLLIATEMKYRNNETWNNVQSIGWQGSGVAGEIFNTFSNVASGEYSHAEGMNTISDGPYSHSQGVGTVALGVAQHVQGMYNIPDYQFLHIVGSGSGENARRNVHTIDGDGTAWFAGSVYVGPVGGANRNEHSRKLVANGDDHIILTSPNGTKYKLTVADDGTLTATALAE